MADIFVDPSQTTNGTGSEANPRNIWPASIGANDRIFLKRGTTLVSAVQLGFGAGTAVTLDAYGDVKDPLPKITITASNFGSFNIQVAGLNRIKNIHFDSCLNQSANGGAVVCSQVSGGRAASCIFENCVFTKIGQNAICINGINTATAASEIRVLNCVFDDIGADCIYGGALVLEVGNCKMTNISTRTLTGDGVGFISADPVFVWIHNNYIDHSKVDCKQCIIIDTETGNGFSIIEDNTLIGYELTPTLHSVLLTEGTAIIRRNKIFTSGLIGGLSTGNSSFSNNLVFIRGYAPLSPIFALSATNASVYNNTFVGLHTINNNGTVLAIASGVGTTFIRNNLFLNVNTAIKADNATNPTVEKNAYWNVNNKRLDNLSAPFAEATEITSNPLVNNFIPLPESPLNNQGVFITYDKDLNNVLRKTTPTIGAIEYRYNRGVR